MRSDVTKGREEVSISDLLAIAGLSHRRLNDNGIREVFHTATGLTVAHLGAEGAAELLHSLSLVDAA